MIPRNVRLSDGCIPNRCRFSLPDDRQTVDVNSSIIVKRNSVEYDLDCLVSVIHEKEVRNSGMLVAIIVEYTMSGFNEYYNIIG